MEDLELFVKRLSKDVGCHQHKNETNYSLQKYAIMKQGHMGVFGWVKETKGVFYVDTYEYLADAQGIADADHRDPKMHWGSKNKERAKGLRYKVRRDSNGSDYQKAVRALRAIMKTDNK